MEYLGSALTRRVDGLDAFAGMQQIGSTLTAISGATASATAIPARFSHLLVEILGLSHDSGANQSLRLELSPDGASWTAPVNISGTVAASGTLYCGFPILGYRRGAGSITPTSGNLTSDISAGNIGGGSFSWRIAAGIGALRFSWTGGANFDSTGAGQIKLHGF